MTIKQIKEVIAGGEWVSIAPEVRPSLSRNEDGSAKPFYLSRRFTYQTDDTFTLEIVNFADAYGNLPLAKLFIKGHIQWQGEHPIAAGAQKVDFSADEVYEVTPLHPGFVSILNQFARTNFNTWEVNGTQSIQGKAFAPFGLAEGQIFKEYDLLYVLNNMLFWGARHVDGRGFDTEGNRPTNLQIPLIRQP
ncbi:hypothetical protein [Spirosoma radiotolerans]|uniref:APCDD1 domain-containing protein n=1 Tax=Spirosoma radiotolerans TaxID=1379870 RepID=A0A0E3V6V9_9BACT|nr:hypothetical protein [Spirosoma radiotolerans]AKD54871.1 hypothetical protein SD10_08120 [Spirosoma radiotolerans]